MGIGNKVNEMKALICGDRDWTDREAIRSWLSKLQDLGCDTVIHGACRGADMIAEEEAKEMGFDVKSFPARWKEYGRAAGPIRNQQMLDEEKPEIVVYFHDDLAASAGTADMIRRASKAGVPVIAGR